jgi:hypothetical protein
VVGSWRSLVAKLAYFLMFGYITKHTKPAYVFLGPDQGGGHCVCEKKEEKWNRERKKWMGFGFCLRD